VGLYYDPCGRDVKGGFMRWILLAVFVVGLAGCSMMTDDAGKLDAQSADTLIKSLKDSGFKGQFALEVNGQVEGVLINGFRGGSPGSHLSVSGVIDPPAP